MRLTPTKIVEQNPCIQLFDNGMKTHQCFLNQSLFSQLHIVEWYNNQEKNLFLETSNLVNYSMLIIC